MRTVIGHFNLYDFFGYIFPGAIILSSLFFVFGPITLTGIAPSTDLAGLVIEALMFLGLSYIMGHIVQAIAVLVDSKVIIKLRGGKYPSEAMLEENNKFFPQEFKKKLWDLIVFTFGLSPKIRKQEGFRLCYTFVIQKGLTDRVERFLGLFAFSRGLSFSFFGVGLFLLLSAYFQQIDSTLIVLSGIMFFLAFLFMNRYFAFGTRFAMEVYREFYVFRVQGNK